MTGAGKSYCHENNYVDNQPTSRVTTGFFSYEFGVTSLSRLKIVAKSSACQAARLASVNPQEEWFARYRASLFEGHAPQKALAASMPAHRVETTVEGALRQSIQGGHESAEHVAEHLGHTLLDPPQVSRRLAAQEVSSVSSEVVRVDRVRHRLACHGDRHARKDVQEMARPLIQDWMGDCEVEKKTRELAVGAIETVEMVDYYRHKKPDPTLLLEPHPEVVICKTTRRNLEALVAFVK